MKKIALFGSTGSIGTQVLNVVERYPQDFKVISVTANSNAKLLQEQINKFKPEIAVLTDATKINSITEIPLCTTVYYGENSVLHALSEQADIVFVALSGYCGFKVVENALRMDKVVALANKESIVAGGELLTKIPLKNGKIIPVDSEHSAIWQCLQFGERKDFKNIIITASGGAFRTMTKQQIAKMPASQALNHPNWKMGKKITVDCATMMNKGLEVIEAKWLFNAKLEQIKVLVHPQSIIHSMVSFEDGATMAQLSYPTMEIPIQLALTYPERKFTGTQDLDLIGKSLTFEKVDFDKFPCFYLALESIKQGGNMPCALSGANEQAVSLYLQDKIGFYDISRAVEYVLEHTKKQTDLSLELLDYTDKQARRTVLDLFNVTESK